MKGQKGTKYKQTMRYSSKSLPTCSPWRPQCENHRDTIPCSPFSITSWVPQGTQLKMSSKIALRIGNLIRQIQVAKLHWRQWDLYKGRFCNGKSKTGTAKSCTLNKEVFQVNLNTGHRFVLRTITPCPANKTLNSDYFCKNCHFVCTITRA